MNTYARHPGPRIVTVLLTLLAVALLWPPGPYSPRAYAQEPTPAAPRIFVPLVSGGRGSGAPAPTPAPPTPQPTPQPSPPITVPDLRFTPDAVTLDPGAATTITVRVEPAADLRGASFELPGVQDGVSSSFDAAADGTSGTLTIKASEASEADARTLEVHGRSGLDSSKTWVGALKITTTASPTAKTIFVDAVNGNDNNAGTQAAAPVKTLTKALTKVVKGDTVKLLPGSYDKTHSGDTYPVLVPNGVKIVGTLHANGAKATFLAPSSSAAGESGLTFAGDASIKDLELDVFGTAITATKGKLTLSNLNFILNRVNVELTGTAQAMLIKADMFMGTGHVGTQLTEQARLTMDGGKISGPSTCNSTRGIVLSDTAQVILKNAVTLENVHGTALSLNNSSKATLDGATIRQTTSDACFSIGISSESTSGAPSNATVTLNNTNIAGADNGIRLTGNDTLTVTGGTISANGIGIEQVFDAVHPTITIREATLTKNKTGIHVNAPVLKMRKSIVSQNETGISVRGVVGFIGGGPVVDLGTDPSIDKSLPSDPGGNNFSGNTTSGVSFLQSANLFSVSGVWAVGNTWNPNVQGADGSGHYPQRGFINGSSPIANGQNFALPTERKSMSL